VKASAASDRFDSASLVEGFDILRAACPARSPKYPIFLYIERWNDSCSHPPGCRVPGRTHPPIPVGRVFMMWAVDGRA